MNTSTLCPHHCLHKRAAGTIVYAGVPPPCHAIHGVAVVNGALGYQIWRKGRTDPCTLTLVRV